MRVSTILLNQFIMFDMFDIVNYLDNIILKLRCVLQNGTQQGAKKQKHVLTDIFVQEYIVEYLSNNYIITA